MPYNFEKDFDEWTISTFIILGLHIVELLELQILENQIENYFY